MDKSKFGGQGVRKQSCIMRRCVHMTSNGSSTSSCTGSTASSAQSSEWGEVEPCYVTWYDGEAPGHPSAEGPRTSEEQALFWAAVSGCMALTGQSSGEDDESMTIEPPHGNVHERGSGSSSPRSPTHSSDSGGGTAERGLKRPLEPMTSNAVGGAGLGELPRSRPSWTGTGGMPGNAFTGHGSFCSKLACVLAFDKKLVAQPVALRALRLAGVIEPNSTAGLAASLTDPSLVGHLTSCLADAAGVPAEELRTGSVGNTLPAERLERPPHLSGSIPTFPPPSRASEVQQPTVPSLAHDALSAPWLASPNGSKGSGRVVLDRAATTLLSGSQLPRAEPRVANSNELRQQQPQPQPSAKSEDLASTIPSAAAASAAHAAVDAVAALAASTRVVDCRIEGPVSKGRRQGEAIEPSVSADSTSSRSSWGDGAGAGTSTSAQARSSTLPQLLSLVAQNELRLNGAGGPGGNGVGTPPPFSHSPFSSSLPAPMPRVVKGHES